MDRGAVTLGVALAVAIALVVTSPRAEAKEPFEAMLVQRLAEPVAAPDLVFLTAEGRPARLGELRGKVVLLGFFTTT